MLPVLGLNVFFLNICFRFYDTAGLDAQQREVPKHLLAAADGFVIVYSVEDKQSYILAESIRKEIKNSAEKKDQVTLTGSGWLEEAEERPASPAADRPNNPGERHIKNQRNACLEFR